MPRRTTRLLAVLGLLAALTACGDDGSASDQAADPSSSAAAVGGSVPDGVAVSGALGKEPKVTWSDTVSVDQLARTVVIEGDGETVGEGDSVITHVWIGNGAAKAQSYSDFNQSAVVLSLGEQTLPALSQGLEGQTVGSRVVIASPPAQAWGNQGNTQLGIGNADTVVFVVDLLDILPDGPDGTKQKPAAWAPTIVETDGEPSSLDFAGTPPPSGRLMRTTVIEGTGKPVTKGQHLYVNYLGQVPGSDKPFDESYSRDTPFDFVIGQGSVVKGWDQGLLGVKVGSRVIVQVPPDKGYGKAGQPDVGIKGTDTMYFVVDVLAAT
ncbi:MAG TPA: FKBP-type peptidyl-prolyl cis-trans isomerase [Nocardioides sp.]|uniref:FKBP-type peptidyl-prolyl cis-trans isomerase n=1 Tax=Nocardioides sp. TaxID=35761 RepID=UPI002C3B759C|nr:FKBP-type peptidyl-prolyl cis-trans isomerase [Nocardioides sp.]HQR28250.1 FKBP-type peptidyl-prolyl cis-trans isomerase [Nocardioides sp.]